MFASSVVRYGNTSRRYKQAFGGTFLQLCTMRGICGEHNVEGTIKYKIRSFHIGDVSDASCRWNYRILSFEFEERIASLDSAWRVLRRNASSIGLFQHGCRRRRVLLCVVDGEELRRFHRGTA